MCSGRIRCLRTCLQASSLTRASAQLEVSIKLVDKTLQLPMVSNGWEALATGRLWLRKHDVAASVRLEGGIPCISGWTAAYRAVVVQDPEFQFCFTNEYWLGLWKLNSGDDQFMSRWVIDRGWLAGIQSAAEAEIETTVLSSALYLCQWLRWNRDAQRSYAKRSLLSRQTYR